MNHFSTLLSEMEFEIKRFFIAFWDAFIYGIRENLQPEKSKKI